MLCFWGDVGKIVCLCSEMYEWVKEVKFLSPKCCNLVIFKGPGVRNLECYFLKISKDRNFPRRSSRKLFPRKKRHCTENCDGIHPTWIVRRIELNVVRLIINPWILYLEEEKLLHFVMTILLVDLWAMSAVFSFPAFKRAQSFQLDP